MTSYILVAMGTNNNNIRVVKSSTSAQNNLCHTKYFGDFNLVML